MVEDNFNQKLKENDVIESNIEVINPMDNFISNLKNELRKVNNIENTHFKIKIIEEDREVGYIS